MLTNWFTIVAQIINFLILVALLKHFLYDRIINAMDERNQKVESRWEAAREKERESQRKAEEFENKQAELEEKQAEIFKQSEEEAAQRKKELIDEARKERDALQKSWHEAIERDKKSFMDEMQKLAIQQVFALCRNTMKNLSDEDLESQVVKVFLEKIKQLDKEEIKAIQEKAQTSEKGAVVTSAFELSAPLKQKVTRTLHSEIFSDLDVDYETDPDLIAGTMLKIDGKKVSWNMKETFKDFQTRMETRLAEETAAAPKAPKDDKEIQQQDTQNG